MKSPAPRSLPRELGSVYTPPQIAADMVRKCLSRWRTTPADHTCRILDPACGDGAFLLAACQELSATRFGPTMTDLAASDRLQIIREHLFGVDIDPAAIHALHSRLVEFVSPPRELATETAAVLAQNFRCGDSLSGPDFSRTLLQLPDDHPDTGGNAQIDFDWAAAFPHVAAAGGFDIIVGNPPYVKERNAKELFDRLAATEIGQQWREARMDLWYYFLHRSLDLLRSGGWLTFIVNSYWMASRSARKLIARLERETILEEIQLLHDAPVFTAVAGRHMIFRLQKHGRQAQGTPSPDMPPTRVELCRIGSSGIEATEVYSLTAADLFQNGRLVVVPPQADGSPIATGTPLAEVFVTRQGIAENPPFVTRRMVREAPGQFQLGAGVFVLTESEVSRLDLSPAERSLLRPYFETRVIRRFEMPHEPTHWLLYLTRDTCPTLENCPTIRAHLEPYRAVLERRREVQTGACGWWHLHWPREERLFLNPKIFSVQMGREPQFAYSSHPAFVGFSVNLILPTDHPGCSLLALTGILNSALAQRWFERHSKRRGVNLEINAHVLREFPLPARDIELEKQLTQAVLSRQATTDESQQTALEVTIESLVGQLYASSRRPPG
ncbi:MAG: Eco57I restriction-modification methylase domain-containing protein [Planctomycetes bacterium]|nr:Eco57I restriction-modification methylase domain-containing protein [Planctomycetota bacterium]